MHFWRFALHDQGGIELQGTYVPAVLALSVIIAIVGAVAMLRALDRFTSAESSGLRRIWLGSAAVGMGFGIWAMHFTGMVAFTLPVPIQYDAWWTALSVAPAVLGSLAAAYVIGSARRGPAYIHGGAVLLAAGIGSMHYLGMEAIRFDGMFHHDGPLFLVSLATAYALALLALYAHISLSGTGTARLLRAARRPLSASLLGLAVAGMHYTAMASTRFYAWSTQPGSTAGVPPLVVVGVIAGMALILGTIYVGGLLDMRLAAVNDALRSSEAWNRAIVESMLDAQFLVDSNGTILSVNPAAASMFGYSADELIGSDIDVVMPKAEREQHSSRLRQYLACELPQPPLRMRGDVAARRKNGETFPIELLATGFEIAGERYFSGAVRDLSEFQSTIAHTRRLLAAIEQAPDTIIILDKGMRVQYANPALTASSGYAPERLLGRTLEETGWARSDRSVYDRINATIRAGEVWSGELSSACADGSIRTEEVTVSPVFADGHIDHYVQVRRDVTARLHLEQQLRQAQKLESIGQLSAGIAHEINTPSQYVNDNLLFLRDAFAEIRRLLDRLKESADAGGDVSAGDVHALLDSADFGYLKVEVPSALEQSLDGIGRVTRIVRAMKEFSHQSRTKAPADLNQAIESTVTVATNEWKYVADVELDFDPKLPQVPCLLNEFNQVILNVIVNAAQAIAEVIGDDTGRKGKITLSTRRVDRWAEVRIADTGAGMTDEVQARVFEPFFTTKEVGKGTGQGMSIAYGVVVNKHGGTISVDSEPDKGTCFVIRLPLEAAGVKPVEAA